MFKLPHFADNLSNGISFILKKSRFFTTPILDLGIRKHSHSIWVVSFPFFHFHMTTSSICAYVCVCIIIIKSRIIYEQMYTVYVHIFIATVSLFKAFTW